MVMSETRPGQDVQQKKLQSLTTWFRFAILQGRIGGAGKGGSFCARSWSSWGCFHGKHLCHRALGLNRSFCHWPAGAGIQNVVGCVIPIKYFIPEEKNARSNEIGSSEIVQSFARILTHTKNKGGVFALCPTKAVRSIHGLHFLTLPPGLECEDGSSCSVYAQNHRLVDIFPC